MGHRRSTASADAASNVEADSRVIEVLDIFESLGEADEKVAEEMRLKVKLALLINTTAAQSKLTQAQTATLLRVSQPQISNLQNYKLAHFSVGRLLTLLQYLQRDIEIVVSPAASARDGVVGKLTLRSVF